TLLCHPLQHTQLRTVRRTVRRTNQVRSGRVWSNRHDCAFDPETHASVAAVPVDLAADHQVQVHHLASLTSVDPIHPATSPATKQVVQASSMGDSSVSNGLVRAHQQVAATF